jgi:hypothetical protein
MDDIRFIESKEGDREAICGRCGGEAVWRFLDERATRVEVMCVDCGSYEMTRSEFDVAETDLPGPDEPREPD